MVTSTTSLDVPSRQYYELGPMGHSGCRQPDHVEKPIYLRLQIIIIKLVMISFDNILDNFIKTGYYQIKTLLIIGLVEFCDGLEFTFMTILMSILKTEWNLNQSQVATLGSCYIAGNVIGCYLCAYFADIIGRKPTFTFFIGLSVLLVYTISYSTTYVQIVILRLLFGLVIGATSPLGYVYITEVAVTKYRGRFSFALTLMLDAGKIYLMLLCFVFLDDYTSGNWRGLIRFNGVPLIICFLSSLIFLRETIRFYLNRGKYVEAFREIEKVQALNNGPYISLTDEQKDGLINWQIQLNELQKNEMEQIVGILSEQFRATTIKLWMLSALNQIQWLSSYLLMPFLFAAKNSGFESMLWMFIVEFIFVFFLSFFIDSPNYGGRLKILLCSSIMLFLASTSLYLLREQVLFLGLVVIKLGTRAVLSAIYIITCENYPLHLRSKACGLTQAVGRAFGIPSPYLMIPLFFYDNYLPFGVLAILSLAMIVLTLTISEDKTLKPLESAAKDDAL